MDKNTIKTVFKEYFHPMDEGILVKMTSILDIDKYVKKLDTLTFVKLFIYAQLKQISSLRDISFNLNHDQYLQNELELKSISASQLSRKLREIPPEILQALLQHLIQKVHQTFGNIEGMKRLRKIHIIDSTTLTLALNQYPWAPKNKFTAGVKIHTRVSHQDDITYPDKIIITPARPADRTQLDSLIIDEKGNIQLFDRGYFDFKKFDEYCAKDIRFITRIKDNTIVNVIEEVLIKPGSTIIREAIVRLGKMKQPLRLVESLDSEGNKVEIVTNDAQLSTEEISNLYRQRWQIELFFKWVKQHLILKKCYGKSSNAVLNQIYIAMIAYCLTILMSKKVGYKKSLLNLQKYLRKYCLNDFSEFIKKLFKTPDRKSQGRRRTEHNQDFINIERKYERGDIEFLNTITYDLI